MAARDAEISRHYSRQAKRVTTSALKQLANYMLDPENILLSGGLPQYTLFPFKGLKADVPSDPSDNNSKLASVGVGLEKGEGTLPLSISLQYNTPKHIGSYLEFLRKHVQHFYPPPNEWAVQPTCGNIYAFSQLFDMFCDEGDYVIVDDYAYTGTLQSMQQKGLKAATVSIDSDGMIPAKLKEKVEAVRASKTGRCVVLYLVATAGNPTGVTMSLARRREIYAVACELDLVIIDDDPYHFLMFPSAAGLPTTFLQLDVESRVIRLESFSKIMAPGLRMGYAIGPPTVIDLLSKAAETSFVQTSGMAMSMVTELVFTTWGFEGWCKWLEGVGKEYGERFSWFKEAFNAEVNPKYAHMLAEPIAGMFVWIQVDVEKRRNKSQSVAQFMDTLFLTAVQSHHVVVVPGKLFAAEKEWAGDYAFTGDEGVPFVRCTFCTVTKEKAYKGLNSFNKALEELME